MVFSHCNYLQAHRASEHLGERRYIDLKDPNVQAYINQYIDQRIIGASRQIYDSLTKKVKTVGQIDHCPES
jgi:hypothetical protein